MNNSGEKDQDQSIVKFIGRPNDSQSKTELNRWKKFLKFIWPWAKEGERLISRSKQLTEEFYQAEVTKKQNEADKFAAEAADIAADKDLKVQQKVKIVNDEIKRIFCDPDTSDVAKQMQLANLIANNPEIAEQLQKIEEMVTKLRVVNFTRFDLSIESENDPEVNVED